VILVITVLFSQIVSSQPLRRKPGTVVSSVEVDYMPHGCIIIRNDSEFTVENGVTGGSGVDGDPYRIENWEIDEVGGTGIQIMNTRAHFIIKNVWLHSSRLSRGVRLYNVSHGAIRDSEITNLGSQGIVIKSSRYITVTNNYVAQVPNHGIEVRESAHCDLVNNNFLGSWIYSSISLRCSSDINIENNTARGSYEGINICGCPNLVLMNNTVCQCFFGIMLSDSPSCSLRLNRIYSNKCNFWVLGRTGLADFLQDIDTSNTVNEKPIIYLTNETDIVVNPINYPKVGYLAIVNSAGIIAEDLSISDNYQGILLAYTNQTSIAHVNVINNYYGIFVVHSSYNNILGNDVTDNFRSGIKLTGSNYNIIAYNNVSSTIFLKYGCRGIQLEGCSSNLVYNNYLDTAYNAFDDGVNSWNTTIISGKNIIGGRYLGGNYYSNYRGTDVDGDGIGDTPHDIRGGDNIDYLPLALSTHLEVPYQFQDGTGWCGPASLTMVLRYYGYNKHVWDVAEDLDLQKYEKTTLGPGSIYKNLYDYVIDKFPELAVQLGKYSSRSNQILYDVKGNISLGYPVILAVENEEGHAIVVTGFNKTGFFVNDPSGALQTWTGRYRQSDIHFYVTWSELYDFVFVPFLVANTGTVLVLKGAPSPIQATLQYVAEEVLIDIMVRHGETSRYSYVDLDKGLTWKDVGDHTELDANDFLTVQAHVSNHLPQTKNFSVVIGIIGEDYITYFENESKPLAASRDYGYYSFPVLEIALKNYLDKTQHYLISVRLLDSTTRQLDSYVTPYTYYVSTLNFLIKAGGSSFTVTASSNSTISDVTFNEVEKYLSFDVSGSDSTTGFCHTTIPKDLLWGVYTIYVDTAEVDYTQTSNSTHAFLYFTYNHTSHKVRIYGTEAIPEFPSFLILPLFMIATLLAIIVYRRKHQLASTKK
jgi:parallel beta-helix repeat protein